MTFSSAAMAAKDEEVIRSKNKLEESSNRLAS
jgi:hypothetical protein